MATTAALLDIIVKADTAKATTALRQVDQKTKQTAATATKAAASQQKLGTAMKSSATSTSRYTTAADKAGKENRELDRSSKGVTSTLKSAAKAAGALATAYIGIGAAKDAVQATTDLAKSTLTLNRGFGLTINTASQLGAVLKARGADAASTGMAFNTLSRQVEAAKDGSDSAANAFKTLGITQKELKKFSPDQTLFQIAAGMEAAGTGTERAAATAILFGRGWKTVGPVLRSGNQALKEQLELANKYGATFGGESIKSIQDLIATERELKIAQLGLQVQFTKEIAPSLITVGKAIASVVILLQRAIKATIGWLKQDNHLKNFIKGFLLIPKIWVKIIQGLVAAKNKFGDWGRFVRQLVGQVATFIKDKVGDIIGFFKSMPGKIKDAFADVGEGIKDKFNDVLDFFVDWVNKVIGILNNIPGVNIGEINTVDGGGGKNPTKPKKPKAPGGGRQLGGPAWKVPGYGTGDKVHMQAMVEPGEGVFVMNRNAMGAMEALNKSVPRFAGGGAIPHLIGGGDIADFAGKTPIGKVVGGAGDLISKLPSPGDLPDWMSGLGTWVIDKASDYIKDKVGSLFGGADPGAVSQAGIIAVGRMLQAAGYQVGEHPAFGGVAGVHVPGSAHYAGRAIDVNHGGNEMAALDRAAKVLMRINHSQIIWRNHDLDTGAPIGGHMDHLHFAMKKGGSVPPPKRGDRWIDVGSHVSVDEAATLLWQSGLSAGQSSQLARVLPGESGGRIRAHNPSGASGIFQIMMPLHSGIVNRHGGNVWDVRTNAMSAVDIYRSQGFGAWEAARSGPAGKVLESRTKSPWKLLQEKGTFKKQSDAVKYLMKFGISKDEAQRHAEAYMLRGGGDGTTGGTGKMTALEALKASGRKWKADKGEIKYLMGLGYTQKQAQAAAKKYNGPVAAAAASGDTTLLDTINEMIGEENLLKLQNYQLGRAQHPMLGLADPMRPGLTPLLTSLPGTAAAGGTAAAAFKPSVNSSAKVGKHKAKGHLGYAPISVAKSGKHRASSHLEGTVILIEDGAVNANRIKSLSGKEAERKLKRSARRGNRGLPSGGGRGP